MIAPFESGGGYGEGDSVDVIRKILRQKGNKNLFTSTLVVDGNEVDQADTEIKAWLNKENLVK